MYRTWKRIGFKTKSKAWPSSSVVTRGETESHPSSSCSTNADRRLKAIDVLDKNPSKYVSHWPRKKKKGCEADWCLVALEAWRWLSSRCIQDYRLGHWRPPGRIPWSWKTMEWTSSGAVSKCCQWYILLRHTSSSFDEMMASIRPKENTAWPGVALLHVLSQVCCIATHFLIVLQRQAGRLQFWLPRLTFH